MREETAYEIVDVAAGKVKDKKGRRAPKKVVETLQRAGVVSFHCGGEINWKVVEGDAQSLFKRLRAARGIK